MPDFIKESELLLPVRNSLARRGYRAQTTEMPFFEYRIDAFGYSGHHRKLCAVELKLRNWKRAFQQALSYQLCADLVYIAMPAANTAIVDKDLLSAHGIGLMAVYPSRCLIILDAAQSLIILDRYRTFYISLMQDKPYGYRAA